MGRKRETAREEQEREREKEEKRNEAATLKCFGAYHSWRAQHENECTVGGREGDRDRECDSACMTVAYPRENKYTLICPHSALLLLDNS